MTGAEVNVHYERDALAKQSTFVYTIRLLGVLEEEQRQRLLEIAHKCPLHLALSQPIAISTSLV